MIIIHDVNDDHKRHERRARPCSCPRGSMMLENADRLALLFIAPLE
jgi:hypothetical protein